MLYLVTFISRSFYVFYVKAMFWWSLKRAAGYKKRQCFVVVVVVVFYARNSVFPELAFKDIIGLNACIANFKPLIILV